MKILMLILILSTVAKYFYLLYKATYQTVFNWFDVLNHAYHVGMILGLAFIARNIF